MLAAKKDAVSAGAFIESSNPLMEPEPVEEEDDDWVIVKKRKITILIPPAPPEMDFIATGSGRRVKRRSRTLKKRHRKHLKGARRIPAVTPSANDTQFGGISLKAQESNHSHDASSGNGTHIDGSNHINGKSILQQQPSAYVDGDGSAAARSRRQFGSSDNVGCALRPPPIGAMSVVNQRLRALNLERKLEGMGGLRRWLLSQGLSRFITLFEREKLSRYQLANLTMSKLRDMGTDAVGPRRKLIHAIDHLCQPYYLEA